MVCIISQQFTEIKNHTHRNIYKIEHRNICRIEKWIFFIKKNHKTIFKIPSRSHTRTNNKYECHWPKDWKKFLFFILLAKDGQKVVI